MKTLLLLTLGGSATALLLLALRWLLFRRMPSTVYYYAWLLVLLRFALPLPGLIPDRSAAPNVPLREPAAVRETEPEADYPFDPGELAPLPEAGTFPAAEVAAEAPAASDEPAPVTAATVPAAQSAPARRTPDVNWKDPRLWLGVWSLGALVSLTVPLVAYARFRRALQSTLRKPDGAMLAQYRAMPGRQCALYVSSAVKTPLTLGLIRPMIVLPEGLCEGETLSNVLRHELTHVRRHDALYKWLALAVFSAHWFNPLVYFLRRELDRACELSCDEALLGTMTREERRAYGNTLLQMAASGALPAGVVATTFSTEKRNLKERLEQIMTYRKSFSRVLGALLALALLAGCTAAAGPAVQTEAPAPAQEAQPTEAPVNAEAPETEPPAAEPQAGQTDVHVSNVDELLAAIAPNTTIWLAKGDYDLAAAGNYGRTPEGVYYTWEQVGDPGEYGLIILDANNLILRGEDPEETRILTGPRYANVLRFVGCEAPGLEALTVGHTDGAYCRGGVLRFERCSRVTICNCGLFGCGTIGVWAHNCEEISVINSRIYECSRSAVSVDGCRDVFVENCEIYDHGKLYDAETLFEAVDTEGFVLYKNRIHDNYTQYLVNCVRSRDTFFLSNEVSGNGVGTMFRFEQYPCVVDGCVFDNNESRFWVLDHALEPVDPDGQPLDGEALENMTLHDSDPNMPFPALALGETAAEVAPGGTVTVRTVDEFLTAIGPDRTIILEGGLFDLSEASTYGRGGSEYYRWTESFDGPKLVIENLSNLAIISFSDDAAAATISAAPRYADVLCFINCSELDLVGFTAGHTKEPGTCAGGVLYFENCQKIRIERCRLYGCGILGVRSSDCSEISLMETEIFECSQGAAKFYRTDGVHFTDCSIHDVPSPHIYHQECSDVTWNGETMPGDRFDVDADSEPIAQTGFRTENGNATYETYEISLRDIVNPFAGERARSMEPNSAKAQFAALVQKTVGEEDFETLADMASYPLYLFYGDSGLIISSREEFLDCLNSESFRSEVDVGEWVTTISDASLDEYALSALGDTVLDHYFAIAVRNSGTDWPTADDVSITAISFTDPIWPGTE